ncbi:hypothetical protein [Streptomyces bicolor]|uniref:hypothetical protein n=1 Tax=Streptomyces bicolor TaxID=66874 RepID=UPI0004E1FDC8|nr:hypothetical protein [Streptomyces bicolor]
MAFLKHLDMEEDEDDDDGDGPGEPTDCDFRPDRAARHAELIAEARDFARRMSEGDIGRPPPASPA